MKSAFRLAKRCPLFSATAFRYLICLFTVVALTCMMPGSVFCQQGNVTNCDLYAVIVGIGKYQDSKLNQLELSPKDAQDFYSFLKEREKLFKKSYLRLFVNEQATRANVTKAIRDDLKPAGKDDIVIIFLSGHGASDPVRTDEFYFLTYDSDVENLFGSALQMNTSGLFKGIDSERLILLSDACHSGGFNTALDKSAAKAADIFFSVFQNLHGRFGFASSRPDEKSWEIKKYGNSIFTHYLLKGLRGGAYTQGPDGVITVKDLYEFVYDGTRTATKGLQNPQLYSAKGRADQTPIFRSPVYDKPLNIEALFVSQSDEGEVKPITNGSTLKSGQRIGVAFKADADCFVHVLWWDSNGNVGRLFPNPKLTEGSGEIKAGVTHWLPYKQGKHWYVLDKNVGEETIYMVASRERNPKLEQLYSKLQSTGLERELNLMGIEEFTLPDKSKQLSDYDRERLFQKMENQIKVVGADKVIGLRFKHVAP